MFGYSRSQSSACLPLDFDKSQSTSGSGQEATYAQIQDRALSLAELALSAIRSIQKWLDDAEKSIHSEELQRSERKILYRKINLLKNRLLSFHGLPEGEKLLFLDFSVTRHFFLLIHRRALSKTLNLTIRVRWNS